MTSCRSNSVLSDSSELKFLCLALELESRRFSGDGADLVSSSRRPALHTDIDMNIIVAQCEILSNIFCLVHLSVSHRIARLTLSCGTGQERLIDASAVLPTRRTRYRVCGLSIGACRSPAKLPGLVADRGPTVDLLTTQRQLRRLQSSGLYEQIDQLGMIRRR